MMPLTLFPIFKCYNYSSPFGFMHIFWNQLLCSYKNSWWNFDNNYIIPINKFGEKYHLCYVEITQSMIAVCLSIYWCLWLPNTSWFSSYRRCTCFVRVILKYFICRAIVNNIIFLFWFPIVHWQYIAIWLTWLMSMVNLPSFVIF